MPRVRPSRPHPTIRSEGAEPTTGPGSRAPQNWKLRPGNRTLDGARGFTGHEQLDRIGLVHMGGRVYDPRLGRFLSPDPVIGNPGSSQSWNLYSYTGNSPMSFTDPTGLVRSSLPWENNACGPAQGCLNLNSDAGGFGETTQRNDSYRTHIFRGDSDVSDSVLGPLDGGSKEAGATVTTSGPSVTFLPGVRRRQRRLECPGTESQDNDQ